MASAHSWHSEDAVVIELIEAISPLRLVAPAPDELISSWLARAALHAGCDPLDLTACLWPGWRAWIRELDLGLPSDRAAQLVASFLDDVDDIHAHARGQSKSERLHR